MTALAPSQAKKSFNRTLLLPVPTQPQPPCSAIISAQPLPYSHRATALRDLPNPRVYSFNLSSVLTTRQRQSCPTKIFPRHRKEHSLPPRAPTTSPTTSAAAMSKRTSSAATNGGAQQAGQVSCMLPSSSIAPLGRKKARTKALTSPPLRPQHMTSRRTSSPPRRATSP